MSAISSPNLKKRVAVIVLQKTKSAHPHQPGALLSYKKIEIAANTHNGNKLYPKILMHVINSTYCPRGVNKFIIKEIARQPVRPKP